MKKILMTAMTASISKVMETMFYMPVEFEEQLCKLSEKMHQHKPIMACHLKFSGDSSGDIILIIPETLLEDMAENFMGTSKEELTNEHISGTLTEILNMICGNALGKVESKVPFALDIPEIIDTAKIPDKILFNIIQTPDSAMAININLN